MVTEHKGIEVVPATEDQEPTLANLLELYAHDFSEFHDVELGVDGRFGYSHLPSYWRDPNRHPFLVRVGDKLAGFVFVKKGSVISKNQNVWDMAEFFIVRKYRRRGVGTIAAHQVWRRFPGVWEVRVMESNGSAYRFWQHAISEFAASEIFPVRVQKSSKWWRVFSFKSDGEDS